MAPSEKEFLSNLEQAEMGFERFAKIIEAYHNALRFNTNLGAETIDRLTLAFQQYWLDLVFNLKDKDA